MKVQRGSPAKQQEPKRSPSKQIDQPKRVDVVNPEKAPAKAPVKKSVSSSIAQPAAKPDPKKRNSVLEPSTKVLKGDKSEKGDAKIDRRGTLKTAKTTTSGLGALKKADDKEKRKKAAPEPIVYDWNKIIRDSEPYIEIQARFEAINDFIGNRVKFMNDMMKIQQDQQRVEQETQMRKMNEHRKTTIAEITKEMTSFRTQVESKCDDTLTRTRNMLDTSREEQVEDQRNMTVRFMTFKSDTRLMVDKLRNELDLDHDGLSSKTTLFALSRIMELMLTHMMVENLNRDNLKNLNE